MEKPDATTEKPKRRTSTKSAAAAVATAPKNSDAAPAAAKKTAAPRTKKSAGISPEMRHQMIADAAYYRAQGSGNGCGDMENWLAAEAEIDAMLKKD